jgi:glucose 1-dehydrogenase
MTLARRIAIVTGAKAGIGLATARRLAAAGAAVVLADIRDAQDEVTAITAVGGQVRFIAADVSQTAEVEALVAETLSAHGRLDILVNNAGVELAQTVADTTEAE